MKNLDFNASSGSTVRVQGYGNLALNLTPPLLRKGEEFLSFEIGKPVQAGPSLGLGAFVSRVSRFLLP